MRGKLTARVGNDTEPRRKMASASAKVSVASSQPRRLRQARSKVDPASFENLAAPEKISQALVGWFVAHARDLPWRQSRDPYAIWISEVMLQQTQVQTVIPYWERWLRELPTVRDLAEAPEAQLLKLWEGLGYYSRVRNLKRGAGQIVERHEGQLPKDARALKELAGIGPYTAGAIASIAFDLPEPAVDGNVVRVLSRLLALKGDFRERSRQELLWENARNLIQSARAITIDAMSRHAIGSCSALNQALMELGAMVCTPRSPCCSDCPVSSHCAAFRLGKVESFPEMPARTASTPLQYIVAILHQEGRWRVQQRSGRQVNGGMWEFPQLEITGNRRPSIDLASEWLESKDLRMLPPLRHSITRYRILLEVFTTTVARLPKGFSRGRWVTLRQLNELPMPSAHRKLAARLGGDESDAKTKAMN